MGRPGGASSPQTRPLPEDGCGAARTSLHVPAGCSWPHPEPDVTKPPVQDCDPGSSVCHEKMGDPGEGGGMPKYRIRYQGPQAGKTPSEDVEADFISDHGEWIDFTRGREVCTSSSGFVRRTWHVSKRSRRADPPTASITPPRFSVPTVSPHCCREAFVRHGGDPPDNQMAFGSPRASEEDGALGETGTVPHLAGGLSRPERGRAGRTASRFRSRRCRSRLCRPSVPPVEDRTAG